MRMKRGGVAGSGWSAAELLGVASFILMDLVLVLLLIGGGLDITSFWPAP